MVRIKIKVVVIFTLIMAILFTSSGCWDRRELEEQAFVIMMGIDAGKQNNTIKLTVMIAIPSKLGGGGGGSPGGGGGKQEESVSIITTEVPSITGGLNTMNTYVSRTINLQHMKMMVIGEKVAKQSTVTESALGAINRLREVRRTLNIIVGKPTAEDFIKSLQPKLGSSPSKYLEDLLIMSEQTGALPKSNYQSFLNNLESYGAETFALLGSVRKKKDEKRLEENTRIEGAAKTDIPGVDNIPRQGGIDIDLAGTAVFKGAKLAGELTGDETRIFNMLRGDFRRAFMTFRDPIERDKIFVIDLRQGSPPRINIKIKDGQPIIDIKLSLEGDLTAYQSKTNYGEDNEKRKLMEIMVAGNINERATKLIKKSQEEFDTDIFGLGTNNAKHLFLTWQDWIDYHWLEKFKDAQVNVIVKFSIRRIGLNFSNSKDNR